MSCYLTQEELSLYTDQPITMLDAENATLGIDAYKGASFWSKKYTEQVKLAKRRTGYGVIYKGRLRHKPRVSIVGVTAMVMLPFGLQKTECGEDSLWFDDDESPYFTYCQKANPIFPVPIPSSVTVTYYAGYEVIPEPLKRATAMLATNLRAAGGGPKWTSREEFDLKITLAKDGVFTSEVKEIINMVELT